MAGDKLSHFRSLSGTPHLECPEARPDDTSIERQSVANSDQASLRQQSSKLSVSLQLAADVERYAEQGAMGFFEHVRKASTQQQDFSHSQTQWPIHDEVDADVPLSLLIERRNVGSCSFSEAALHAPRKLPWNTAKYDAGKSKRQCDDVMGEGCQSRQKLHDVSPMMQAHPSRRGRFTCGRREKALWRWTNITRLDSFMEDIYHYFEGGGILCILCSNILWLLKTLFVVVLLTFLAQCVDYSNIPYQKSLTSVLYEQCSKNMSGFWSIGLWLYSFFFVWKLAQYCLEFRRLSKTRDFFVYLLEIPDSDMQTVSWQEIVARIMILRDQNPKTAQNLPPTLRRYIGSQSKERLDAHDIANRPMRKQNYFIAMINQNILNLTLPIPFLRHRQLFSKTMEWYLHYGILDMAFNEMGQVRSVFMRPERRAPLSQRMKQRLYFAGLLNLIFAPIVLAYVVIMCFFTYYNEYQKDPELAAARKYTALAEWKLREFNELPHIFHNRLRSSFPFATRYINQFPKRMTEDIARSIGFMSGAIVAVLAVLTLCDSESFLSFEITADRTVLFYLGVFGSIWAISRGIVTEATNIFDPERALLEVIQRTHYVPDHWRGRLHSFEVKQEFAELYKMKAVILLEEIMGIIITPLLLFITLPKCTDRIVDFFREFTVHIDGLGSVCSFAHFELGGGMAAAIPSSERIDVREDDWYTRYGKMAASYYGFLETYPISSKTEISDSKHLNSRPLFQPPPTFPSLNSPTLAADMLESFAGQPDETDRARGKGALSKRMRIFRTGPGRRSRMTGDLLDPFNRPRASVSPTAASELDWSQYHRELYRSKPPIVETAMTSPGERGRVPSEDVSRLGGSKWESSPAPNLSQDIGHSVTESSDAGIVGLIWQLRQIRHDPCASIV